MKRVFLVALIAIVTLIHFTSTTVFAENIIIRAAKGLIVSPLESSFEFVTEMGKSLFKKGYGPVTSTLRATSQTVGRIGGDLVNIVKEDAYQVEYFEANDLTLKIDPPVWVDYVDYAATGLTIGIVGVNSNCWGGAIKDWTRAKAAMIGATAGAATADTVKNVIE